MSSAEKAFALVKAVFTFQEKIDAVDRDIVALSERLTRLADSHVGLRDRVGQIEGYLKGATGTPFATPAPRRIEG